jgi:hypothetical protein
MKKIRKRLPQYIKSNTVNARNNGEIENSWFKQKSKTGFFFSKDGIGGKGNIEPVHQLKRKLLCFSFLDFFILFQNYVILPRRSYENIHFIPIKSYMPRPFSYSIYCSSCSCFLFMLKRYTSRFILLHDMLILSSCVICPCL